LKFRPQQKTDPELVTAHVWLPPAETATEGGKPLTAVGWEGSKDEEPLPSLPMEFSPQHLTLPSRNTAQL
jgi:hypothetical protein